MNKTVSRENRPCSMVSETGNHAAHWESMLRKFSDSRKEECSSVKLNIPRLERSEKQLPTGSTYEGTWDVLGMGGYGTYTFPEGDVVYEGGFDDGVFHGRGELRYGNGVTIKGMWRNGVPVHTQLFFPDGLEYKNKDWKYLTKLDRRFAVEYKEGLQPAGALNITPTSPSIDLPPGFYDVGNGFYEPKTKLVYSYKDPTVVIRTVSPDEHVWILINCRKGPDAPVGPNRSIYEDFCEPKLYREVKPPAKVTFNTESETKCCSESAMYCWNKKDVEMSLSCCSKKT